MTLEPCVKDAENIMRHPDIHPHIIDDGCGETFRLPSWWLNVVAYLDKKPIGCLVMHMVTSTTLEVHVQVLPQYRKQYAQEIGRKVLAWTWDNNKVLKLTAQIPECYKNVLDFALSMGFEIEGINSDSIMKDGKLISQFYLGLKRCQEQ